MLVDAAMLSSSPHHLHDSVCFMRFVGTVIENQGGAHRRQLFCMYCVDTVLKCLPCFLRFRSHYVDVWLSGWCRELVDRGLTLGWAQITAMVAHKVVHWVRQVSPLSFWATLSRYKISAKARILGCINISSHAYKDRVAAYQLESRDIDDFSFLFYFLKTCSSSYRKVARMLFSQVRVLVCFGLWLTQMQPFWKGVWSVLHPVDILADLGAFVNLLCSYKHNYPLNRLAT